MKEALKRAAEFTDSAISLLRYHVLTFRDPSLTKGLLRSELASHGQKALFDASNIRPNSLVAQASLIDIHCRDLGDLPPDIVEAALTSYPEKIKQIIDAAQIRHKNLPKPPEITYHRALRTIKTDFKLATYMHALTYAEVKGFSTAEEDPYSLMNVLNMVNERRKASGLQPVTLFK
jgi:hypothetical protein